jgi:hypothetical protein
VSKFSSLHSSSVNNKLWRRRDDAYKNLAHDMTWE